MYFNKYIPELFYGKMSRLGPPTVEPLDRFYMDENTIAVTYLLRTRYNNTGFDVKLSVYDLYGNLKLGNKSSKIYVQNSVNLASVNVNNTILSEFKATNVIERTGYENQWKKDVGEFGIQDNTIVCYNRTEIEQLSILPNGKISISKIEPSFAVVDWRFEGRGTDEYIE